MEESRGQHDPTLLLPENQVIASLPLPDPPSPSAGGSLWGQSFSETQVLISGIPSGLSSRAGSFQQWCQSEVQEEVVVFRLGDESSPPDCRGLCEAALDPVLDRPESRPQEGKKKMSVL